MGARASGIPPIAKVGLNLAAKWLQIAADGERDAWAARAREEEIGDPYDLPAFGDALDAELRAGLVAIAGAAFSIDAVYGLVVDLLPEDARPRFAEGTPRAARIVETLKLALDLGKRQHEWQKAIPALFKLRDPAVHHDGTFYETAPHPVGLTNVSEEQTRYCAEAATHALDLAFDVITAAYTAPRRQYGGLAEWAGRHAPLLPGLQAFRDRPS